MESIVALMDFKPKCPSHGSLRFPPKKDLGKIAETVSIHVTDTLARLSREEEEAEQNEFYGLVEVCKNIPCVHGVDSG